MVLLSQLLLCTVITVVVAVTTVILLFFVCVSKRPGIDSSGSIHAFFVYSILIPQSPHLPTPSPFHPPAVFVIFVVVVAVVVVAVVVVCCCFCPTTHLPTPFAQIPAIRPTQRFDSKVSE